MLDANVRLCIMAALTPEGKIKRRVREVLQAHKIWYFLPGNNGFGKSGIPDFVCIVDGGFVGIECKADKTKTPTALQVATGEQIVLAGGRWFLVRCDEDVAELDKWLRQDAGS